MKVLRLSLFPHFLSFGACLALLTAVSACGMATQPTAVGVLSAEAVIEKPPTALSMAAEQNLGYQQAETQAAPNLSVNYKLENDPQDEIQITVRKLVEDKSQPVLALVGATSNENSTRLASLSNFFNLPVIIPSVVGDNVLPSNNLWGFRLSAPGSAHAQYLFGSVVTHLAVQAFSDAGDLTAPPLKVAILYEQNTFGESAAVAAATAALQQKIEIGLYGNFDPHTPDLTRLKEQAGEIQSQGVQLVYLISSQPEVARAVLKTIEEMIPPETRPVLLGQSGAFASHELLISTEAQGMFVLRQKIVADKCPATITSLAEAQSYAAVTLMNSVSQQAREQAGKAAATQTLLQKREALRDILKIFSAPLPCLGPVSFDNTGQNKDLQFEIVQITKNGLVVMDVETFQALIKQVYQRSPFN